ncbi:hypothetical protein V1504DRAFT_430411 [Lipomyces starkeyi]
MVVMHPTTWHLPGRVVIVRSFEDPTMLEMLLFPHTIRSALLEAYRSVSTSWHHFLGVSTGGTGDRTNHSFSSSVVSNQIHAPPPSDAQNQTTASRQQQSIRSPLGELTNQQCHSTRAVFSNPMTPTWRGPDASPTLGVNQGAKRQFTESRSHSFQQNENLPPSKIRRLISRCHEVESSLKEGNYTPKEAFDSLFIHLPKYRVMICDACPEPYAVVPAHVEVHVRKYHRHIPSHARICIRQYVECLPDLAHKPEDVICPVATSKRIPELPVYEDA